MTLTPARQRWLIAILVAVFLLEVVASSGGGGDELAFTLVGPVVMLGCVYYGVGRPEAAALVAGLALVGSSWVIYEAGVSVRAGIEGIKVSEMLAGGALAVLLAWRARPTTAVLGLAALTVGFLMALGIRGGRLIHYPRSGWDVIPGALDLQTLVVGFFLLAICVGAGAYLRVLGEQRTESQLQALVRRQWPLAAALVVLLLFDIGAAEGAPRLLILTGAGVAGVCAFFAPRAPVRAALTGAAAIGVAMVPYVAASAIELTRGGNLFLTLRRGLELEPFSLTQVAATMALIAFVVRYARPQPAAWSTVALVAANAGGLIDTSGSRGIREDLVLPMGFLLVVSIATGLYFRARDRERNQSVRVAVSGAQNAERLALARELHDVVAHHVTGIVVQAQAARLVADRDPKIAVGALEKIENSGTEALTAMRMLVGSLRGAEPAGTSTAASQATSDLEADIRALVGQFQGPTVHLELELPAELPHEMGRSVLRLVQESLTNVSKHAAGAKNVWIGVTTGRGDTGEELHVFVKDDGTARRSHPAGGSGGYGLVGMRERVELLGGFFSAGPSTEGGWVVKVAIPLRSKR